MDRVVLKNGVSYHVRDGGCIGRSCLNLHPVAIRGTTAGGTRFTGRWAHECAQRYHHGCPQPIPEYDSKLAAKRRKSGFKSR